MVPKKVLVVGGAGYIGCNLHNYLHRHDMEVKVLDKAAGQFGELIDTYSDIDEFEIEAVVHLAAFPGVVNCINDPERAVIDNISSAFKVFAWAHSAGVPVVFASSQAAKKPEENFYSRIKRIIEIEAERYNNMGGDVRVLRFTNVYGGREFFQKKSTVIAKFVHAVEKKEEMVIYGDGSQTRDFIHVDDICNAIYKCLFYDRSFDKPIDIGTGKAISIKDLADFFVERYNAKFTFDKDSDIVGPSEAIADIDDARATFGFMYTENLFNWIRKEL